jgi:hypothetical protein
MSATTSLKPYVRWLEEILDFELTPAAVANVRRFSPAQFKQALERAQKSFFGIWAPSEHDPEKFFTRPFIYQATDRRPGEYRPLLHPSFHSSADPVIHIRAWDESARTVASNLGLYLLYAHRVVIPEPLHTLLLHCDMEFRRKESIERLVHFLEFVDLVRPLIDAGVVEFYPNEETYEYAATEKDEVFLQWVQQQRFDAAARLAYEGSHVHILRLLRFCTRYDATVSIEDRFVGEGYGFRHLRNEDALIQYLKHGRHTVAPDHGERDLANRTLTELPDFRVLGTVLSSDVLSTAALDVDDILALRGQSSAFDEWRTNLLGAIRFVEERLPDVGPDAMRSQVAERLAPAEARIKREAASSSSLISIRDRGISFAIGAVAGFLTGGTAAALPAGALALGGNATWDWLKGRGKQRERRALLNHYALWTGSL